MKLNYIKLFIPLLVVLLGVFIYVSRNDEKAGDKPVPLAERYHLNPGTVALIEITGPDGTARMERRGDHWQMSQPGDFPADPDVVDAYLQNLLALTPDRILASLPPDKLTEFGLDRPAYTVQLSDERQVLLQLALGESNAAGSGRYAKAASDGAVLTLPVVPLEEQILNHQPNSFRSRQILQLNPAEVVSLQVFYPATESGYTIERQPDGWMVTEPFLHRAKERLLDATFIHLEDYKVDEFLATPREMAAEDPAMGLLHPQVILTLTDSGGKIQSLSLGSPGGDLARLYATSSTLPEVFLAQQHLADHLRWKPEALKEDRLVIFGQDAIAAIEVRLRGADNLLLERTPDGTWRRSKPTIATLEQMEIQPLLAALTALAPQDYIEPDEAAILEESDLGFTSYTLRLELRKTDSFKSQDLTIGKLHRRRGYFTRDSLTPGIYLLPEEQVKALESKIEEVRGGNAPREAQQAWSEAQKKQMEDHAKKAAEEEKKNKRAAKKSGSSGPQGGGNGLRK